MGKYNLFLLIQSKTTEQLETFQFCTNKIVALNNFVAVLYLFYSVHLSSVYLKPMLNLASLQVPHCSKLGCRLRISFPGNGFYLPMSWKPCSIPFFSHMFFNTAFSIILDISGVLNTLCILFAPVSPLLRVYKRNQRQAYQVSRKDIYYNIIYVVKIFGKAIKIKLAI